MGFCFQFLQNTISTHPAVCDSHLLYYQVWEKCLGPACAPPALLPATHKVNPSSAMNSGTHEDHPLPDHFQTATQQHHHPEILFMT